MTSGQQQGRNEIDDAIQILRQDQQGERIQQEQMKLFSIFKGINYFKKLYSQNDYQQIDVIIEQFTQKSQLFECRKGERIYNVNEKSEYFYLLLRGKAAVLVPKRQDQISQQTQVNQTQPQITRPEGDSVTKDTYQPLLLSVPNQIGSNLNTLSPQKRSDQQQSTLKSPLQDSNEASNLNSPMPSENGEIQLMNFMNSRHGSHASIEESQLNSSPTLIQQSQFGVKGAEKDQNHASNNQPHVSMQSSSLGGVQVNSFNQIKVFEAGGSDKNILLEEEYDSNSNDQRSFSEFARQLRNEALDVLEVVADTNQDFQKAFKAYLKIDQISNYKDLFENQVFQFSFGNHIQPGEPIGGIDIINKKNRSNTIVAVSDCYLAMLNQLDYTEVLQELEEMKFNQKLDRLCASLNPDLPKLRQTLQSVVFYMQKMVLQRGQYLYRQEDSPIQGIYLIKQGQVQLFQTFQLEPPAQFKDQNMYRTLISKDLKLVLCTFIPGQYLGEDEILTKGTSNRFYSARVTQNNTIVYFISKHTFYKICLENEYIERQFQKRVQIRKNYNQSKMKEQVEIYKQEYIKNFQMNEKLEIMNVSQQKSKNDTQFDETVRLAQSGFFRDNFEIIEYQQKKKEQILGTQQKELEQSNMGESPSPNQQKASFMHQESEEQDNKRSPQRNQSNETDVNQERQSIIQNSNSPPASGQKVFILKGSPKLHLQAIIENSLQKSKLNLSTPSPVKKPFLNNKLEPDYQQPSPKKSPRKRTTTIDDKNDISVIERNQSPKNLHLLEQEEENQLIQGFLKNLNLKDDDSGQQPEQSKEEIIKRRLKSAIQMTTDYRYSNGGKALALHLKQAEKQAQSQSMKTLNAHQNQVDTLAKSILRQRTQSERARKQQKAAEMPQLDLIEYHLKDNKFAQGQRLKMIRRFYQAPEQKKELSSTVPFKVLFNQIKQQVLSDTVLNRFIRTDQYNPDQKLNNSHAAYNDSRVDHNSSIVSNQYIDARKILANGIISHSLIPQGSKGGSASQQIPFNNSNGLDNPTQPSIEHYSSAQAGEFYKGKQVLNAEFGFNNNIFGQSEIREKSSSKENRFSQNDQNYAASSSNQALHQSNYLSNLQNQQQKKSINKSFVLNTARCFNKQESFVPSQILQDFHQVEGKVRSHTLNNAQDLQILGSLEQAQYIPTRQLNSENLSKSSKDLQNSFGGNTNFIPKILPEVHQQSVLVVNHMGRPVKYYYDYFK